MTELELSLTTMALTVFAGIVSVASPCVLPIVPIIVTGTDEDHKYLPILIVLGLSISFIIMGVATSLFGSALAGVMPVMEKAAGVLVLLFGVLMLFDINLFKRITFFSRIGGNSQGRWSGLIMGLTLGLVWIPCVGPMLAGVLTLVATDGRLSSGIILLACYSVGFAIPMLLLGYASQTVRQSIKKINTHPLVIRLLSGGVLIAFGIYILTQGMFVAF
ncbi:MAG: cytochrome C biogenesis protein [Desulfuromonas sp.]|nr:MAG: cytochrome C biogenesis protein [Desulfuromonas sp.]